VSEPVARIRIAQMPKTRQEIYALERACLKAAKQAGLRGKHAKVEAERIYNAAVEEAQRKVREPETQQPIIRPPATMLAQRQAPRGMVERGGLFVPEAK